MVMIMMITMMVFMMVARMMMTTGNEIWKAKQISNPSYFDTRVDISILKDGNDDDDRLFQRRGIVMTETLCGDLGAHIDAWSSRVITYIGLLCPWVHFFLQMTTVS